MSLSLASKRPGRIAPNDPETRPAAPSLLQSHNVRLRLAGGLISVLGDQFYLIALPWLVPQLTGNAFAVGTGLALVQARREAGLRATADRRQAAP